MVELPCDVGGAYIARVLGFISASIFDLKREAG